MRSAARAFTRQTISGDAEERNQRHRRVTNCGTGERETARLSPLRARVVTAGTERRPGSGGAGAGRGRRYNSDVPMALTLARLITITFTRGAAVAPSQ